MTLHAEDALACTRVTKVLDFALAVAAFEAVGAKRLVAGEYGQIFDFVSACAAAVGAIIADERAVAKKE